MMSLYSDDNDDDIYLIIMIMLVAAKQIMMSLYNDDDNLPVSLQAGASLGEPGQVVGCTSEEKNYNDCDCEDRSQEKHFNYGDCEMIVMIIR